MNNHLSPGPFNSKILYCAPVWCHSACTCLIDHAINNTLQTVTGCLRPTQADNLLILTGIQPAELRRIGATLSLAHRAIEPGQSMHICSIQRSLVHRVGMHGISNRDTHLYLLHNTLSIHLTTIARSAVRTFPILLAQVK